MIELLPFFALVFYLAPFMVAVVRDHDSPVSVLMLNLLLGWTGIGWIAALIWAAVPGQAPSQRPISVAASTHQRARGPVMPRILDRPSNRG